MLMEIARHRLDTIFEYLDIRMHWAGDKFTGQCPIHGGTDPSHFLMWPTGEKSRAFWTCVSHHCERNFSGNIVGLIQGVMSHHLYGWAAPKDTRVPWEVAVEELCKILDVELDNLEPDMAVVERNRFCDNIEAFVGPRVEERTVEDLRHILDIPAQYYINRGYTEKILERFGVGYCNQPDHELYGRVVVPFYSPSGRPIGHIGRNIHDKCPECEHYHPRGGVCYEQGGRGTDYCKWLTQAGFKDKNYLYNYWNAVNHVIPNCDRIAVIVEGCGDVWRLEEAGIKNAVAINGADMSDTQRNLLTYLGATELLCLTDNDQAGEKAFNNVLRQCQQSAKVRRIRPVGAKDVGELKTDDPLFAYLHDYISRRTHPELYGARG
jgi:hypothetical protein